jgi:hypothetical protein
MTIAATRMYRGLDDFLSTDTSNVPASKAHKGGRKMSVWGTPAVPIQLDGVGVTVDVHTAHTQSESLTSQTIPPSLGSSMDRQLQEKSDKLV